MRENDSSDPINQVSSGPSFPGSRATRSPWVGNQVSVCSRALLCPPPTAALALPHSGQGRRPICRTPFLTAPSAPPLGSRTDHFGDKWEANSQLFFQEIARRQRGACERASAELTPQAPSSGPRSSQVGGSAARTCQDGEPCPLPGGAGQAGTPVSPRQGLGPVGLPESRQPCTRQGAEQRALAQHRAGSASPSLWLLALGSSFSLGKATSVKGRGRSARRLSTESASGQRFPPPQLNRENGRSCSPLRV